MANPFTSGYTGRGTSNRTGRSGDFSVGKSKGGIKSATMQQFTPEQMQLFQQMFGHLGPESFLGKLASGDQSAYQQMEAPAWRDFQSAQGNVASRFSGMGQGATRSSGFKNTMGQMGSDFAQNLQANRLGIQNQALKDLMNMSNQLMGQRPYENFMWQKQKKPGFLETILGGIAPGLGYGAAGGGFGNRQSNNTNQAMNDIGVQGW